MPRVGFEPTIPVFERAKTVHALDRAATVIGYNFIQDHMISSLLHPTTVFRTLLTNIVKLYYPFMAIDHVSHQNKTRYKITALYTLLFTSLDPKEECKQF
jgi:hypothetical protein